MAATAAVKAVWEVAVKAVGATLVGTGPAYMY